jgi:long-chain acyl-CoA synthetase
MWIPSGPEDAALYAAPMSHGAGIYAPIHVRMGAAHIVPVSGGFEAEEVLDLSERHGATSMFMAPTMVRRLTDAAKMTGRRGEGIKTIVYGGGPMYRADIEEAVDWFGPKFVQIYGQGECPMAISALSREEVADRTHPRWGERLASVGAGAVAGRGRDFGRAWRERSPRARPVRSSCAARPSCPATGRTRPPRPRPLSMAG